MMVFKDFKIILRYLLLAAFSLSISIILSCDKDLNSQLIEQDIEKEVQDILSKMTLDEKVGQMTQVSRRYLKNINDIKKYYLGSILSGGNSVLVPNNATSWADLYDKHQTVALQMLENSCYSVGNNKISFPENFCKLSMNSVEGQQASYW